MALTEDAGLTHSSLIARVGIPPKLIWGYVGLLIFMLGDGIESGYLSPYLISLGISEPRVAWVFTAYGLTAAVAAWLSGALSDLWGPRRVMWIGLVLWVIFELALLILGIPIGNPYGIAIFYALRGFGYPLFAFGFLVWITAVTPRERLGSAVGWFWFAFTGGLPTLGSLFASYTLPVIGPYRTLWCSLVLIVAGGLLALLGVREQVGSRRLVSSDERPLNTLFSSIKIAWQKPKTAIGCVVRVINTAPQFGFLVFLPSYFTETVGFSLEEWLRLLSLIFLSNILGNLTFGVVGDKLGWRETVAIFGGLGSAIATLLLYYAPSAFGKNYLAASLAGILYGVTLAGYVPLSALMPSLAPEQKGAAMSLLNLGAGISTWFGPAVVALFLPATGVVGVIWIFAALYLLSSVLTLFLTLPAEHV